ncbi:hypothetical protein MTR_7g114365 [Medicago truncatula]|uniref:Uncharacterized protein n=1 Tax=Medicago truncatula TaxID=3880 RepID=A0A072U5X6_MEDTR|nr:hypothetical protein MTR_7g114365 [Medicago truncatula]
MEPINNPCVRCRPLMTPSCSPKVFTSARYNSKFIVTTLSTTEKLSKQVKTQENATKLGDKRVQNLQHSNKPSINAGNQ